VGNLSSGCAEKNVFVNIIFDFSTVTASNKVINSRVLLIVLAIDLFAVISFSDVTQLVHICLLSADYDAYFAEMYGTDGVTCWTRCGNINSFTWRCRKGMCLEKQ